RIGIVENVHVPSLGWHFGDGIDTAAEVAPETVERGRSERKATRRSDDGDRFAALFFDLGQAMLERLDREQRISQSTYVLGFRLAHDSTSDKSAVSSASSRNSSSSDN